MTHLPGRDRQGVLPQTARARRRLSSPSRLACQSLAYYWRAHLAVALGSCVAASTLTGALLVGDSMRGSLRDLALGRLGDVHEAVVSGRFFRQALADDIAADPAFARHYTGLAPVILLQGAVTHADTRALVGRVNVFGVDGRFWGLDSSRPDGASDFSLTPLFLGEGSGVTAGRSALLNEPLARALGAAVGDDVIVRFGRPGALSAETLMGRRDDTTTALRLNVKAVVPADGLGAFSLSPAQFQPHNLLLPLELLQRTLDQPDRVNLLLAAAETNDGAAPGIQRSALSTRHSALSTETAPASTASHDALTLEALLERHATLDDLGLRIRVDDERGYLALESDEFLIDPAVEAAAMAAARDVVGPASVSRVLAYLADSISKADNMPDPAILGQAQPVPSGAAPPGGIPYSTVVAVDALGPAGRGLSLLDGDNLSTLSPGEIVLNAWAADDLGARTGDAIALTYRVAAAFGRLESRQATFRLRGVAPMVGPAADPGWIPEYRGITDSSSLRDWDPPIPIDLSRIRDQDEAYWDAHRATPKAFISLADGRRLWADQGERFGAVTSIRPHLLPSHVLPSHDRQGMLPEPSHDHQGVLEERHEGTEAQRHEGEGPRDRGTEGAFVNPQSAIRNPQSPRGVLLKKMAESFARALRQHLDTRRAGLTVEPIRRRAAQAARGSTDFGALFLGFSFFLIAASAMLVALLFRLGIERRAHQIGVMLAAGFTPAHVRRLLIGEGAVVAAAVTALGLVGALAFAWLMLAGLGSVWSAAVSAPVLTLHASGFSLALGPAAAFLVAAASMAWSIRGLTGRPVRALLAGRVEDAAPAPPPSASAHPTPHSRTGRAAQHHRHGVVLAATAVAAILVISSLAADALPRPAAFFASGVAILTAGLALVRDAFKSKARAGLQCPGAWVMVRLGLRNAPRHAGRSLLTVGLIAGATFVIIALGAFQLDAGAGCGGRDTGCGGYSLFAEAASPLLFDLNTADGRRDLGCSPESSALMRRATFMPFRLRPGDEASCTSLFVPTRPRLLGAAEAFVARGGFRFAALMNGLPMRDDNPWTLLHHAFDDGAIPVIGDEAAAQWQLHRTIGEALVITDQQGHDVPLRFVALLRGSALQSELIITESQFVRLFPSMAGHSFFLIDAGTGAGAADATALSAVLEDELSAFGLDVEATARRLADYFAVQNTYLSTFQTLGGFGLVLGTLGLAAVLLRNVNERRGELALMRALGFSNRAMATLVLSENAALTIAGLAVGTVAAVVAISPQLAASPQDVPWRRLALLVAGVFAAGLLAGGWATRSALKTPLLNALRSE